jgi:UDP-N-acetylmuramoyl-L-alanyl-D-glutamate--2,6-diaminopimelate ligase
MNRPIQEFSLTFSKVAELIGAQFSGNDFEITGVSHIDSEVIAGDLFAAIPGAKFHGADFIKSAQKRGALAVITDQAGAMQSNDLPTLVVNDVRGAAALVATSLYQSPMRDLVSVGVTGTNGKTTVTTLLHQLCGLSGREGGLIGTVETCIGNERIKSVRTTPEATELQALVAVMRERHVRQLVMEVSSHALAMGRMKGSHFSVAAFTNLTQDHLDFHHDMESYFAAKSLLFTHELSDVALINIDNQYGAKLAQQSVIQSKTISRQQTTADWHYSELHTTSQGFEFAIRGPGGILIESRTPLFGSYNADNLLMAIALGVEIGIDPIEIATHAPLAKGAPGRLQSISLGQPYKALVDYAHSPDAVKNVLMAAREFTAGKIIAVLGCGGDRDTSKRPQMGRALLEGCDIAIFTSDNPRTENPDHILQEMTSALSIQPPSHIISDRAEAIAYAVTCAKPGDSILVLGKGHEKGQEVHGKISDFDDRLVLAAAIEGQS